MKIVLVHGAWGNASVWSAVAAQLAEAGALVTAIDLPGHGDDPTPPETVRLADYAEAVVAAVGDGAPALLVGHSMGGMAISAAAELAPDRVRKLVYVAAFLPQDGDSVIGLMKRQGDRTIGVAVRPGPVEGVTVLDRETAGPFFVQDATPDQANAFLARLNAQPNAPQTDKIALSAERFGRIPRAYILCEDDRTVLPTLQREMIAASPCAEVETLSCGHFPQITAARQLSDILLKL